ncbi:MAG: hypothetical protein JRL30_12380 [Deltaproteobacteria bacterium]|nr:hypothetical protein [Deltaproteobacteria bacterium]
MEISAPGGHLDQYIRQSRAHHVQLSYMADMKANMVLTIASLMIPLSLRYLNEPEFKWAAATMICFCILTVMMAAFAAMPKVPLRTPRETVKPDLGNPSFNILYFGNFFSLDYMTFVENMQDIMNDHSRTYESQLREIYVTGQYLAQKKFRFVRLAYLSFMIGLACTLAVYLSQQII